MIKKYKWTLIVTSFVILLPILAGLILWDQLPEQMATHFGAEGEANGWSSRGLTVFGFPVLLLGVQWLCMLATAADPKRQNISRKAMALVLWIVPVLSLLCSAAIYAYALGIVYDITMLVGIFMGILFLVSGNYLPKSRQNYSMGIKIAWTLHDEENWNHTHRFAGWLYMGLGLLMIVLSLLDLLVWALPIIIVGGLTPIVYSWIYYVRHKA